MAGIAPFIARPARRFAAGLIDFVLSMTMAGFLLSVIVAAGYGGYGLDELRTALVVYAAYHAVFFFVWDGQTPGLRTFDMKVVSGIGGTALSRVQIAERSFGRPALLHLLWWFGNGVRIPIEFLAVIVVAPLLVELAMMFTLPSRQTLSDLLSRTLVVNVPPPQPHRAPAAPMYSASDAEFGLRPRRVR